MYRYVDNDKIINNEKLLHPGRLLKINTSEHSEGIIYCLIYITRQ